MTSCETRSNDISKTCKVAKLRRGFNKGLALLDILLQLGQARFQQLLFLRGQFSNGVNLFNTVQLGGRMLALSYWVNVFGTYTELDIG